MFLSHLNDCVIILCNASYEPANHQLGDRLGFQGVLVTSAHHEASYL